MKPRTRLQKKVAELSAKLPALTDRQREYFEERCFKSIGRWSGRQVWCERCGTSFPHKGLTLADTVGGVKCPCCGRTLEIMYSRIRKLNKDSSFSIITTCKGIQVMRFFEIFMYAEKGRPAMYYVQECLQNWLHPTDGDVVVARRLTYGYNMRYCRESDEMGIRGSYKSKTWAYALEGHEIWPRIRLIPELRKRGLTTEHIRDNVFCRSTIHIADELLHDPHVETLVKAGWYDMAACFASDSHCDLWPQIRICLRKGYRPADTSLWADTIYLLRDLGRDILNPHYICPDNLKEAHDRWAGMLERKMEREREREERESLRKRMEMMDKENEEYISRMREMLDISIMQGDITIRPLRSVREFYEEGKALHHCVYAREYYKDVDSLILTAIVGGEHTETAEIDLREMSIVQCRGDHNENSRYHNQIVDIINANMGVIRKAYANINH